MEKVKGSKVVVAMSGGVDSSVAAALLKKEGFDVIGVFMHFWSETPKNGIVLDEFVNRCCSLEAENSARSVAKAIGIPFYTVNAAKRFKKTVVDYFLREFQAGRTPNPCTVCNREIKFGFLLKKARELGAELVATGHYARSKREIPNPPPSLKLRRTSKSQIPFFKLLKAKDKNKDQSYFLYGITQDQLAHYLFPVGGYLKTEVRKIAKKLKLPTADRPESQEICFISDNDIRRFLKEHLKLISGKIIDTKGKILGNHPGLPLFTIGQRHGLGIGGGKPYYVTGMNRKNNLLVVTSDPKDKLLYKKSLIAKNVNWLSAKKTKFPLKCLATIRYRHKPESAVIRKASKGKYSVTFAKPQRAITPGQAVVFYRGDEVLGGGVISGG